MFEVSLEVLLLLLGAAFFAGFLDSIAGGGGLIALPALLLAGAPPVTALATNKLQGMFGTATAAWAYAAGGHVSLRRQALPAAIAFAASMCGALVVSWIPTEWITYALPFLMIAIALYFALKKGLDDTDRHERLTPMVFSLTMVPLLAFYDGVLGPGTGSFFMLAFVTLGGAGILKATARTKLLNFASNAGAIVVFAFVATPWWATGLAMGAAQIAGAKVGSSLAQKKGAKLIKPLLVLSSSALAIRLMWEWF
ncbi:TSUP family transporter [Pseudoruegeria sp. SHC-113]|uniref:TSUP family transporter n=1 Tax=Pseudoruegeria sp. SHC-113 TaxID=2855439 RepID=UPI0021BAB7D8|nr:TSUP family transporter [Pseudoruegeria sp. SHC-113]MCT8158793.1 TSUP family transporter [Pseudoruegeria sp. SHC-113]